MNKINYAFRFYAFIDVSGIVLYYCTFTLSTTASTCMPLLEEMHFPARNQSIWILTAGINTGIPVHSHKLTLKIFPFLCLFHYSVFHQFPAQLFQFPVILFIVGCIRNCIQEMIIFRNCFFFQMLHTQGLNFLLNTPLFTIIIS